jgi:hypothetical protein
MSHAWNATRVYRLQQLCQTAALPNRLITLMFARLARNITAYSVSFREAQSRFSSPTLECFLLPAQNPIALFGLYSLQKRFIIVNVRGNV